MRKRLQERKRERRRAKGGGGERRRKQNECMHKYTLKHFKGISRKVRSTEAPNDEKTRPNARSSEHWRAVPGLVRLMWLSESLISCPFPSHTQKMAQAVSKTTTKTAQRQLNSSFFFFFLYFVCLLLSFLAETSGKEKKKKRQLHRALLRSKTKM